MRIDFITVLPEIVSPVLQTGMMKRAVQKGLCEFSVYDLHDFSPLKTQHIDDTPYGGGAGMVLSPDPLFRCIEHCMSLHTYDEIIFFSPDGEPLTQPMANSLSLSKNLLLISGRYKGIDQRVRDQFVTKSISIGDYVLTGGELPSLILADAIIRLIPGVISDSESSLTDSFQDNLLDAPHYTKPSNYRGLEVPQVLLSGNHSLINEWKLQQSLEKTKRLRPDLLDKKQ
jgi:tRNA (guanine37-N1)-methyltransferase